MAATTSSRLRRPLSGGWLLAAAQCAFALWFAASVYLALKRASQFAGYFYVPSAGDALTAEIDVAGGWGWALPVTWTLTMGPLLAGLSFVASVVLLVTRHARGNRGLLIVMIGGAAAAALTVAVGVTPDVLSIAGWLSD
ncbi:hypothetical protein AB0M02_39435 [Actinoplanes sp. NPDC051861]|uniref:hypothetical protein n=1 Tax=Actinoplanes sp. NPDC051861 TaxID=3155170 RepID=UPI003444AE96